MRAPSELRSRLRAAFAWRGDRWDPHLVADEAGWWREPALLRDLGAALADPFREERPTVVLGLQSRGMLLGALVAREIDLGLVEVRKEPSQAADSDTWVMATAPPDYRQRSLRLGFRRDLVRPDDRVLLVDDWVATGGQALGTRRLVSLVKATWLGVSVIVDALDNNHTRRDLGVRALLHLRDL